MTPSIDGELLDRLQLEFADHRGAENAITSDALSAVFAIEDADTNPTVREAIKVLTDERLVPVVGDYRGYYIPTIESEARSYVDTLNQKLRGIEHRREAFVDAWEHRHGPLSMSPGEVAAATDGGEQA